MTHESRLSASDTRRPTRLAKILAWEATGENVDVRQLGNSGWQLSNILENGHPRESTRQYGRGGRIPLAEEGSVMAGLSESEFNPSYSSEEPTNREPTRIRRSLGLHAPIGYTLRRSIRQAYLRDRSGGRSGFQTGRRRTSRGPETQSAPCAARRKDPEIPSTAGPTVLPPKTRPRDFARRGDAPADWQPPPPRGELHAGARQKTPPAASAPAHFRGR